MTTETVTATKTCASCVHFNASASECRRRAPQTVVFQVEEDVKFESRFPSVTAEDWCGEYTAK